MEIMTQEQLMSDIARFKKNLPKYRKGGAGFILWAEENVWVTIVPPGELARRGFPLGKLPDTPFPTTGRSWKGFWEYRKKTISDGLTLNENGTLQNNLLLFSEERGEGKSFAAVLIQLWKAFCFPDQKIFLCANSKDQSLFAHYDEAQTIIQNSPVLLTIVGGASNLKLKQIEIKARGGKRVLSFIRPISSFNGIMSNATGFTFSEFWQAKMPTTFFGDIYSSMRNTPNALGVIDSTVSTRDHTLFKLYKDKLERKSGTETTYFHYKCNPTADWKLYEHPANDERQIKAMRRQLSSEPGKFEMFFQNTWDSAASSLFPDIEGEASHFLGADGALFNQSKIIDICTQIDSIYSANEEVKGDKNHFTLRYDGMDRVKELQSRLIKVDDYISVDAKGHNTFVSAQQLSALGDLLDTDWAIGVGIDRNDILARASGAQTGMSCVAKGLPGSKSDPLKYTTLGDTTESPKYIYILLACLTPSTPTTSILQSMISEWHEEYNGLETLFSDRFNMQDMPEWLMSQGIMEKPEVVNFSYKIQKEVYGIAYSALHYGRFKKPRLQQIGTREEDILVEQWKHFTHTVVGTSGKYESDEKRNQKGVQDDALESWAGAIYGLRKVGLDDFKSVTAKPNFGIYIPPKGMILK